MWCQFLKSSNDFLRWYKHIQPQDTQQQLRTDLRASQKSQLRRRIIHFSWSMTTIFPPFCSSLPFFLNPLFFILLSRAWNLLTWGRGKCYTTLGSPHCSNWNKGNTPRCISIALGWWNEWPALEQLGIVHYPHFSKHFSAVPGWKWGRFVPPVSFEKCHHHCDR